MGLSELLDRIKAALGISKSREQSERRPPRSGSETAAEVESGGTTVTVEREPSTDSEDAVKGTDTAVEAGSDEPMGTAESASDVEPSGSPAEPSDKTGQEPEAIATEDGSDETETEPAPDVSETNGSSGETEANESPGTDEPTDVIKGIGSTYADRLADAGVETVADLAARDAGALAEETDISEKRLGTWIERAKYR